MDKAEGSKMIQTKITCPVCGHETYYEISNCSTILYSFQQNSFQCENCREMSTVKVSVFVIDKNGKGVEQ
jgi:transcription elongation factor Elf1